MVLYCAWE